MKRVILLMLLLASFNGFSQNYTMTNGNISTCTGTFYDDGFTSNYSNNANLTYTICSNTAGFKLDVAFTAFDLESGFDDLCIYDGNSTGSPLIGCFSGNSLVGQNIVATGGCLTFQFSSDGSVNRAGWQATINCTPPCQSVNPIISSVVPAPVGANNDIKLCIGGQVQLSGSATFPQNNTYYAQSIATSTFKWFVGGGLVQTGQNASITYTQSGKNGIYLVVEDIQGCTDTVKVGSASVGLKPSFASTTFTPNDTICLDDSTTISIAAVPSPITIPTMGVAGTTFLPDGSGVSYTSSITVNSFLPGATFQDGYLNDIFVEMEHSYLGDLEIEIVCPNSQSATLKENPGGLGTHLGEPIDQGTSTAPGIGYLYSFTTKNPTYGTMVSEAGNYQHNYIDVLGFSYNNQDYLPAGSYKPSQNFNSSLIGCPLNGTWSIIVTDHIAIDDGYIFKWGLNFDKVILPDTTGSILPSITTKSWNTDPTIIRNPDDSTITVLPTAAGSYNYTFNITDDWGCSHDTTVEVYVKPRYTANAGPDNTTCNLSYNLAPVPHAGYNNPIWSYNSTAGTATFSNPATSAATATASQFGQFEYIYTEDVNGCTSYPDTVVIDHVQLVNTIDIAVDFDTICLPQTVNFTNNSDMTQFDNISWDFGDGNTAPNGNAVSHDYANSGCYDLHVKLSNALGCEVDSVLTNFVCAYDYPTANFSFAPFEPIVPETNVTFTDLSSGMNLDYLWDFDGLGSSTLQNPQHQFPINDGGVYPVTLTVTNEGGCSDAVTRNVIIKNPLSIYIPNSFSPNGDGYNDEFSIVLTNTDLSMFEFRVFDRWGNNIYRTADYNDVIWNGTHEGVKVPEGVYAYQIRWKAEGDVEAKKLHGHITLIR